MLFLSYPIHPPSKMEGVSVRLSIKFLNNCSSDQLHPRRCRRLWSCLVEQQQQCQAVDLQCGTRSSYVDRVFQTATVLQGIKDQVVMICCTVLSLKM